MARLSDVMTKALSALLGFDALTAAGLAINAAAAATFKTVNALTYTSDGLLKSKAATAAIPFSPGHKTVPLGGYICLFVVGIDAVGAFSTYQAARAFLPEAQEDGAIKYRGYDMVLNAAGAPIAVKAPVLEDYNCAFLPDVPPGVTAVGIIKVTATSANFVPGTSALDLAGTSVAYFDVCVLPGATNL